MTDSPPLKPPSGLRKSGRALWRAVVADFDLDEHELQQLREACRTTDLLDRLQTVLDDEGVMAESSQGVRVHPAAVELRQQRVVLARLLAALNIPSEDDEQMPGVRGVRGVYGIKGAV